MRSWRSRGLHPEPRWLAIACAVLALLIWAANEAVARMPVTSCTTEVMQRSADLLLARVLALGLPLLGGLLAATARRAGRMTKVAAALNLVALLVAVAFVCRLLPLGRLPCLRS